MSTPLPPASNATLRFRRWRLLWGLVLLLVCLTSLVAASLLRQTEDAQGQGFVNEPVVASRHADYSPDRLNRVLPPVDRMILKDVLRDRSPDTSQLPARLATLEFALQAPIPTATPLRATQGAQTLAGTPTAFPASPTLPAAGTPAPTFVPTQTATSTQTLLPSRTLTASTLRPTQATTGSLTRTPTLLPSAAPSKTSTPTSTLTKTPTPTPSVTPARSATPAHTSTQAATLTSTSTRTPATTPTATPTATPTRTLSPTNTAISTSTAPPTVTASPTPTATQVPSPTPSPTPTLTPTAIPTATTIPTAAPLPTNTASPAPLPTLAVCETIQSGAVDASEDAWMDGTKPSINNGAAATLYIRPTGGVDKRALIKFDLSGPQFAGKTILAAILYIYDDQGDRTFSVDVLPVTSAWDEMSVTWDTAPTFDSLAAGTFSLTNTKCVRGGYIRPDVIQNWIDHPEANFGVMLYPPSGAGDVKLSSREGIMAPKLWVELEN